MKMINRIYIPIFALLIASLFTYSCSDDRAEELTSIDYERLFSPIDISVLVINRVDARIDWAPNAEVESYTLEVFQDDDMTFAGTPVRVIEGVRASDIPYDIKELEGETRYSVRIKAVTPGATDSKWKGITFMTAQEDISQPFESDDIGATQATLRWIPGRVITQIKLEPGNITHTVTSEEITAGAATVSGLTGSTNYSAVLLNGTKARATINFETLLDLGGAIEVTPEDDFNAMLALAEDGDAFALHPGKYGNGGKVAVNKNIEIRGVFPSDRPVISGYISIEDGASLLLKDIILDGADQELAEINNHAIIFNTAGVTYGELIVEGSIVRNVNKGLFYLNVASLVETITFNNNIIHDVKSSGSDFMDSRSGAFNNLNFTNNTVYNSVPDRDFLRYDDKSGDFPAATSIINIDHNTIHGVINGSTSRRLLYVRFVGNKISFTNNIVSDLTGIFTNQANTDTEPTLGGNNFFNAPNLFSDSGASSRFFDDSATKDDPGFVNAAAGDFTVTNIIVNAKGTGDPRWLQ